MTEAGSVRASLRVRTLTWLQSPAVARIAAVAIGAVFLAAAIQKIADPPGFAHEIANYKLLPPAAVHTAALVMPWFEAFCGLALVFGPGRRTAGVLVVVLLVLFVGALGTNLVRGRPVDCGCFSTAAEVRTPEQRLASMRLAILRDIGFLVLAAVSLRAPARR
jgi:uncharacterized membrane protein YphA (DoxX/SURF4 family)